MNKWIWFLIFDAIFAVFLFLLFFHRRARIGYNPNTINYNENMTEFCYIIPKRASVIREYLQRCRRSDSIRYIYEAETDDILFFRDLTTRPEIRFHLYMTNIRGGTYLRIVQTEDLTGKNALALRQNDFWHRKLDALPVPFDPADDE